MKKILLLLLIIPLSIMAQRDGGYEPMDSKVWFKNNQEYTVKSKELASVKDANKHFKLGEWAWDSGLEDEAWEQWQEAIKIDKNHKSSYERMGFVQNDKKEWVRPGKVNKDWIKKVDKSNMAMDFTIAIEDDADDDFMEEFSWRIKRLSWFIWDLTEGQVYLRNIKVVDKSSDGRFIIEKGKLTQTLLQGGGAVCYNSGREDWLVKSGGRCYVRIFCHEFFHGIFGLPDERHGCFCLMQGGLYGIKTPDLMLCDKKGHRESTVTPTSCWELVVKKYPHMVHPNKVAYGKAPDVNISIKNN